jgi:hypothetical protein
MRAGVKYGEFAHKWHRGIGKSLVVVFCLWLVVAVAIVGSAILDVTLGLGWGYKPKDALLGVPFIIAGCAVMGFIWLIYRFVGRINSMIYGADEDGRGGAA